MESEKNKYYRNAYTSGDFWCLDSLALQRCDHNHYKCRELHNTNSFCKAFVKNKNEYDKNSSNNKNTRTKKDKKIPWLDLVQ